MARMTLEEIRTRASTVDRAKVDATTEAEIEAHRAADGDADLDVTVGARSVEPPRALRVRLGMTQPEMAAALGIPLGTWRNWEQGRVSLEPAAAALLRVVSRAPAVALAALGQTEPGPSTEGMIVDAERRITEVSARLSAEAHARNAATHGRSRQVRPELEALDKALAAAVRSGAVGTSSR